MNPNTFKDHEETDINTNRDLKDFPDSFDISVHASKKANKSTEKFYLSVKLGEIKSFLEFTPYHFIFTHEAPEDETGAPTTTRAEGPNAGPPSPATSTTLPRPMPQATHHRVPRTTRTQRSRRELRTLRVNNHRASKNGRPASGGFSPWGSSRNDPASARPT